MDARVREALVMERVIQQKGAKIAALTAELEALRKEMNWLEDRLQRCSTRTSLDLFGNSQYLTLRTAIRAAMEKEKNI